MISSSPSAYFRFPARMLSTLAIGVTAFAGTAFVPLWSLRQLGLEAPFRYFAADAFYYLAIAKNSLGRPIYTYDGIRPTNGFNPLWEYYLSAGFATVASTGAQQLLFAFLSSTFFAALGMALVALSFYSLVRRPALVLVAVVPGFYYLAFGMLDGHFGAPWSFVNGMESGLSILLFGVLLHLLVVRDALSVLTTSRVLAVSSVVTLLTLSRLDDVFMFAPIFSLLALRATTRSEFVRYGLVAASVPTFLIGGYLSYNYTYSGMIFPISGVAKSYGLFNPIAWMNTLRELASIAVPPGPGSPWAWSGAAWRAIQLTVPLACSLCFVWYSSQRRGGVRATIRSASPPHLAVLLMVGLYIPIKAGYNLVYVHLWDQGHWYFPLSLILTNLAVLLLIDSFAPRGPVPQVQSTWQRRSVLTVVATGAYLILSGNAFVQLKHYSTYGADFYNFWRDRATIAAQLDELRPDGGILEYDDGIVAYSLPRRTISGMTLAGDAEVLTSSRRGELLEFAYRDGARLIASVWYMQEWPDAAFTSDDALRAAVQTLAWGQKIDSWKFTLLLHKQRPEYHFVVVAFEPKPPSRP